MILIHGSPGVRLGFVNSVLTNTLKSNSYDVGYSCPYYKLHFYNNEEVKNYNGKKIYIKLSNDLLFLHLFLFFEKNVLAQDHQFKKFHYTHRNLFDKFYYFSKMCFEDEKLTDFSLYDYVVPFEKTYDIDYLTSLYYSFNGAALPAELLESIRSTNYRNLPEIPKNHAVRVAAAVFNFEQKHNYTEEDRLWAINDVAPFDHDSGECMDPDNFFDNVNGKLTVENYK